MAFTNDQVGIERGATQLLLDREPRIMNRNLDEGPERADTNSLVGTSIGVEYIQTTNDRELRLALENMSESQAGTLRTLLNGTGPITVKTELGVATTITALFARGENDRGELEAIVGEYPEGAPAAIRRWRAELRLLRL